MQGHQSIALFLTVALIAGCHSVRPMTSPVPVATTETAVEGKVVGDDRTAMEAAIDGSPTAAAQSTASPNTAPGGIAMAPNAPDSYTVKRGDTLWGIAKLFLRDPWVWPEIWQVNPQVKNPHRIYPGDVLHLVYVDGHPQIVMQRSERGGAAQVEPRVRSQPLEAAVTTIPYETVAAFMSKPSVLDQEQIKNAPYVLATRDLHVAMAEGDTIYARGFSTAAGLGSHYNVVHIGDELRDPDDNRVIAYDGVFTGSGRVTRSGDPATLILTESARESQPGDKLFAGGVDVPLDFIPSSPKVKVSGRIISVTDGVSLIGQFQVVAINRGARDGLSPGNVLAVFEAGATMSDTVRNGFQQGSLGYFSKKVKLPDERSGTFMVFKTFDRMSYGLIMEASDIIRVLDRVENP